MSSCDCDHIHQPVYFKIKGGPDENLLVCRLQRLSPSSWPQLSLLALRAFWAVQLWEAFFTLWEEMQATFCLKI